MEVGMTSGKSKKPLVLFAAGVLANWAMAAASGSIAAESVSLWQIYETALKSAKYVDLTHTITPRNPGLDRVCGVHLLAGQGRHRSRRICQEGGDLHLSEARL
jgi:hypothetical protein